MPSQNDFVLQWKRPSNVPFPKVWRTFRTPEKNGKSYTIRIEDLTEDRYDEANEFLYQYHLRDEPIFRSCKLRDDPESVASYHLVNRINYMVQNVSVIAVIEPDPSDPQTLGENSKPKIVCVNIRGVTTKGDSALSGVSGDVYQRVNELFHELEVNHDPTVLLQTDKYLYIKTICVDPAYRGMNIGYEVLDNLAQMARAFQVPASIGMFTAICSQKIALKLGFTVFNQIVYEEYKKDGKVAFPVQGTHALKWMGKKYDI